METIRTNDLGFYNDTGVLTILAKQFDTSRKFAFNIMDNDEPYDLSGCQVYMRILKADNTQFQGHECCSVEGNVITVDTSVGNGNQILTTPGINKCELHLEDSNGNTLTTWDFNIKVEPRVHNGDNIVSKNTWDLLDGLTKELEEHVEKSENLTSSLQSIELRIEEKEINWNNAETKRQENEISRQKAEDTRKTNENSRISNESSRATAETNRVVAENTRKTNENTRKSNETTRISNENSRITAENTRKQNENIRQSNEETRDENENIRKDNEDLRASNETDRTNAEQTRITNENTRKTNEANRITAESIRENNETVRKTAETTRNDNEETRQTQESQRISEFDEIKDKFGELYDTFMDTSAVVKGVKGSSETEYRTGQVNITAENIGLGELDNTSDKNKPVSTAQQTAIDIAEANAKNYADEKISELINGAPTTLDTLKEISDAFAENKEVIEALEDAIGNKVNTTDLTAHISNKSNPHGVTKSQVGLNNVPNVTTNDQTPTYTTATTLSKLSSGEKISIAFGKIAKAISDLISHIANKSNPHSTTKSHVGLGNVDNTADVNKNVKTSTRLVYQGNHNEVASGTTGNATTEGMLYTNSMYMTGTYNDSATPAKYGNIVNLAGLGSGQLLCEWSGSDNVPGHLYYRSHRDTETGGWSPWITMFDSVNYKNYVASTVSATIHSDYPNNQDLLITKNFMSYWNGSYNSNGNSNLAYCNKGAFGDMATKSANGYIAKTGASDITGNLEFSNSGTSLRGIMGTCGDNDHWRIVGGATGANAGYLEIATSDDASEPIYVRQYNNGKFGTLIRSATLLDGSGNTNFPGIVSSAGNRCITTSDLGSIGLLKCVDNGIFVDGATGQMGGMEDDGFYLIITSSYTTSTGQAKGNHISMVTRKDIPLKTTIKSSSSIGFTFGDFVFTADFQGNTKTGYFATASSNTTVEYWVYKIV